MLIDSQYLRNSKKLVLSYIDKTGKTKLKYYDWANPEKYQTWNPLKDDESTKNLVYKSWDGSPVKRIAGGYPDRYATYEFLDALPQAEKDEIFEYNEPEIYFIDIETEILDGFPDAETAPTRVLAISIVYGDKIILMGVKEMPEDM